MMMMVTPGVNPCTSGAIFSDYGVDTSVEVTADRTAYGVWYSYRPAAGLEYLAAVRIMA